MCGHPVLIYVNYDMKLVFLVNDEIAEYLPLFGEPYDL